jgi:hypothetical protein
MLNVEIIELMKAVVNRIIPPDEDPGGIEAGVVDYLLRLFEREKRKGLSYESLWTMWRVNLNEEALTVTGRAFTALTVAEQDALLANIEQGKIQGVWQVHPMDTFNLVVEQCAEGFYADPGNGGNHGEAAWKMIGFEVTA